MCPTTDDIRANVVRSLQSYLVAQPAIKRLARIPTERELSLDVRLRDLRFDYRDNQAFGRWLTQRGLCTDLPIQVTMPWKSIEDVVATVIRYPVPIDD